MPSKARTWARPTSASAADIFATLASQAQGYGILMFTPEQQAAFIEEWPALFVPIAGGWGRMGMTHLFLAKADEDSRAWCAPDCVATAHRGECPGKAASGVPDPAAFTSASRAPGLTSVGGGGRPGGLLASDASEVMKQAIQEGFILDVLSHYTPVDSYYKLVKTVEADPEFEHEAGEEEAPPLRRKPRARDPA